MKLVIQRCLEASVKVDEKLISSIDKGLLILLGVSVEDVQEDVKARLVGGRGGLGLVNGTLTDAIKEMQE